MTELSLGQRQAIAIAQARAAAQQQTEQPTRSSNIFPVSRYGDEYRLDWDAGITGAIGRAISAPGEAMRGELQVMDEQGNITDDAIGRSLEFASIFSPANPAVRAGDRAIPGATRSLRRPRVDPPSAEQLRQTAGAQYDMMRSSGATYPADDIVRSARTAMARMNQDGFNDATAPRTFGTLQRLTDAPEGGFGTIEGLHAARRTFGRLAQQSTEPTEREAARRAMGLVDEFIQQPSGTPTTAQRSAASTLNEANQNYAAGMRSREIGGIAETAELRSSAANSGQNLGNQIRGRVATGLTRSRPFAGYSQEELAALEQIVLGTPAQNGTRYLGNLLGGGGGLGGITAAGLGGAAGAHVAGPVGLGLGAAGTALTGRAMRSISNKLTENALRRADILIRQRSPLYQQMLREVPARPGLSTPQRMSLVRAVMALELSRFEDSSQEATGALQ